MEIVKRFSEVHRLPNNYSLKGYNVRIQLVFMLGHVASRPTLTKELLTKIDYILGEYPTIDQYPSRSIRKTVLTDWRECV